MATHQEEGIRINSQHCRETSLDSWAEAFHHNTDKMHNNDDLFLDIDFDDPDNNNNASSSNDAVVDIRLDEKHKTNPSPSSSSSSDRNRSPFLSRRRSTAVPPDDDGGEEIVDAGSSHVLRCSASLQRRYSNLGTAKTKSRLLDPPAGGSGMMMRSGPTKSGTRVGGGGGGQGGDEEEEDPLFDGGDLPEEYRTERIGLVAIAEWISLLLITAALACSLAIPHLKFKKFRGLSLWKWEVLVMVLICGGLVSEWGIKLSVLIIERNFVMRKRVLYFVYGVRKAVRNCIWLGLVLIAWRSMFDNEVEGHRNGFLRYVNRMMVCMLVGSIIWLVKTLMVKVLASSFHVTAFFDRIHESLFNQYVIEKLSGPALVEIRYKQEEEERTRAEICRLEKAGATLPQDLKRTCRGRPAKTVSFKISGEELKRADDGDKISMSELQRLNHRNVSAWSMKRLMRIVKHGVLRTLDERVLDSSKGDESETATQIRSEREAIAAARKIFRNVAKPRSKFIYLDDLRRFLVEEEALKTLNLVEGSSESERISKTSLKSWVVNSFLERRALALTLNDTKTAVRKLHQMVNVIVGIVILIICLMILQIATGRFFLYLSSQIVVVAFIFGNTCKTIFESIIFVFVIHPFDVGDRCEVDNVQMVVEEMNILTTIFLRYDNQKITYPNSTLSTRPISNYYRSPDMGDSVDFSVHIATPAEKIGVMRQRIINYIESRSDHWYPEPAVVLMNFEKLHALQMSVWLRHRMNHQNMGEKCKRRALLVEEMVKIFKDLDIEYRLYPIDINVRAMPQANPTSGTSWTSPNPPTI
ncbi:hypothetical protein M569_07093 [Genlisea aurea]|uniref:Mechanosensitive ion channel protein n=1 Tax=Genlisea aurea TaxID=192259 RepID=S8CKG0_9LAMI|nr:hypothetical protein M569_07093 [Genlisea aurea]